jgi:PhnB protein
MPDQWAEERMAWIEAALAECPTAAFQDRLRNELERRIRMLTLTGIPVGYTTVTPYITMIEIDRFIEFTKQAFGAVEMYRSKSGGGGTHCELRIGDSMVMCGGGEPARGREKLNALHIYVPDTDSAYRQALEAGAEPVTEPEDKPYGERQATVKDPAGNLWFIATHKGPTDGVLRTVTPYLRRKNALGLIEFLKEAFNATEVGVYKTPEGVVMHAVLRIGDGTVELGDTEGTPSAFYLYVQDADSVYQQALAAGAKSISPPKDQSYGNREGGVEDPWGNTWYIAQNLGSAS